MSNGLLHFVTAIKGLQKTTGEITKWDSAQKICMPMHVYDQNAGFSLIQQSPFCPDSSQHALYYTDYSCVTHNYIMLISLMY